MCHVKRFLKHYRFNKREQRRPPCVIDTTNRYVLSPEIHAGINHCTVLVNKNVLTDRNKCCNECPFRYMRRIYIRDFSKNISESACAKRAESNKGHKQGRYKYNVNVSVFGFKAMWYDL